MGIRFRGEGEGLEKRKERRGVEWLEEMKGERRRQRNNIEEERGGR